MIPEQVQSRRGEPVIVTHGDGTERIGTIEWGDDTTEHISVYCEVGGRVIVYKGAAEGNARLRPDPGGQRPVWARVSGSSPK
jgi:hypothetical protein